MNNVGVRRSARIIHRRAIDNRPYETVIIDISGIKT
jgi:hypothetical protein